MAKMNDPVGPNSLNNVYPKILEARNWLWQTFMQKSNENTYNNDNDNKY